MKSVHTAIFLAMVTMSCKGSAESQLRETVVAQPAGPGDACSRDVAPLLDQLFSSLGRDCPAYVSLFERDAAYFHQHDGYKTQADLLANCQGHAQFCPGNECRFLQNGAASRVARDGSCHLLVPYLWSELPANHRAAGNLEPHTGWEYIVATPAADAPLGYRMRYFAEIETSYSVAFNWAKPDETPALVADSALQLLRRGNSASRGECDRGVAPVLSQFFDKKTRGGDTWRQQGDAVVLAAGGVCHVAVPYAAQVGGTLQTGHIVLILKPTASSYQYDERRVVVFPRAVL